MFRGESQSTDSPFRVAGLSHINLNSLAVSQHRLPITNSNLAFPNLVKLALVDPVYEELPFNGVSFDTGDVRTVSWPDIFNSTTAPKLSSLSIVVYNYNYDTDDLGPQNFSSWISGIADLAPQLKSFAFGTGPVDHTIRLEQIPWQSFTRLKHVYLEGRLEEYIACSLFNIRNLPSTATLSTLRLSVLYVHDTFLCFELLMDSLRDPTSPLSRIQHLPLLNFGLRDIDRPQRERNLWEELEPAIAAKGINFSSEEFGHKEKDRSETSAFDPW